LYRFAEAESILKAVIAIREKLGPADTALLKDNELLAQLSARDGKPAEAESLFYWVYTLADHVLGAAPDEAAFAVEQMAMLHIAQRDYPGAESLLAQAVLLYDAAGPNRFKVLVLLDTLAVLYDRGGMTAKAESTREVGAEVRNVTGRLW
jgi:hypothetical protein